MTFLLPNIQFLCSFFFFFFFFLQASHLFERSSFFCFPPKLELFPPRDTAGPGLCCSSALLGCGAAGLGCSPCSHPHQAAYTKEFPFFCPATVAPWWWKQVQSDSAQNNITPYLFPHGALLEPLVLCCVVSAWWIESNGDEAGRAPFQPLSRASRQTVPPYLPPLILCFQITAQRSTAPKGDGVRG